MSAEIELKRLWFCSDYTEEGVTLHPKALPSFNSIRKEAIPRRRER
jgi:hypothetical protein